MYSIEFGGRWEKNGRVVIYCITMLKTTEMRERKLQNDCIKLERINERKERPKGNWALKKFIIMGVRPIEHDGNERSTREKQERMLSSQDKACRRGKGISMKWVCFHFSCCRNVISALDVGNTYIPLRIPAALVRVYTYSLSIFLSDWRKYFTFSLNKLCRKIAIEILASFQSTKG